jgi:ketosteroid isomerase-like protein
MSEMQELLRRVEALESTNEIHELISAYAIACDEHDMPRLKSLFTPDATFDSLNGTMNAKGIDEIMEMFYGMLKIRGPGYHWTHDHFIKVDPSNPDRATGLVLGHAETSPNGRVCLAAIRYEDKYRRHEGSWRFHNRKISFLYYVPANEFDEALTDTHRFRPYGEKKTADFPESLPAWKDFAREHVRVPGE